MSAWLTERDLPYRSSQEKAYSTDANIWGATHEAKTLEHLDESMEVVEPIMGVRFWDPAVAIETEDVTVAFVQGRPVAINGVQVCKDGAAYGDRAAVDMRGREVLITIDLHAGDATATVWTNDLTAMYVHENSAYST